MHGTGIKYALLFVPKKKGDFFLKKRKSSSPFAFSRNFKTDLKPVKFSEESRISKRKFLGTWRLLLLLTHNVHKF